MLYVFFKKFNMCLVYLYNLFWFFFVWFIDLVYSSFLCFIVVGGIKFFEL